MLRHLFQDDTVGKCAETPTPILLRRSESTVDDLTREVTMFGLLSVLPAVALIHFWRLFNGAKVVTTDNPPKDVAGIWDWSVLKVKGRDDPARICTDYIVDGAKISCEKNATILPGLEPTVLAFLTAAAVLLLLMHWQAVFRH